MRLVKCTDCTPRAASPHRPQAPRDAVTSALCPENRSIRGFCRRLSAEAARSLAHRRLGLRRRQPALRAPAQMAEPPAPAPPAIQTPATLPAVTPPPTEPLPPALCARRARAVTPLPPWPSPRAARQRAICATTCSHRSFFTECFSPGSELPRSEVGRPLHHIKARPRAQWPRPDGRVYSHFRWTCSVPPALQGAQQMPPRCRPVLRRCCRTKALRRT